jgi:hypothetical protein
VKRVKQPDGSRVCGQVAVATLLQISLDEACELVGHRHGTKTRELARVFRDHGWSCRYFLRPYDPNAPPPGTALFKFSMRDLTTGRLSRRWHWVLWADEQIWNGWGRRRALRAWRGGRWEFTPTSYLELTCVSTG